jgi:hypothetical protein
MSRETLYIVTCVANPIGWDSRIRLARQAVNSWLTEPNVHVTLVECAYGSRDYDLADLASPRVNHIPVRANTMVWSKECLQNIGLRSLPSEARKVGLFDADITFRKQGWATETIRALDLYHVVQPWTNCIDLGPNGEIIQVFTSFCHLLRQGKPVVGISNPMLSKIGVSEPEAKYPPHHHHHHHHHHHKHHHGFGETVEKINAYPHPGFATAWQSDVLMNHIGGLFELGGMGAGDHHMMLSLINHGHKSVPTKVHPNYLHSVNTWQQRAFHHVNQKIGIVHQSIEHPFHGKKKNRAYNERWQMFIDHQFDPYTDLKRNQYNVLEFSGSKPLLERSFDLYMRQRHEDSNDLE